MKKRLLNTVLAGMMTLSLCACGQETQPQSEPETPAATETTQEASQETPSTQIANPWHSCTEEEAYVVAPNGFSAPEGATNVEWSMCDDLESEPGYERPMVQMTFDYNDMSFCAREQAVLSEEIVDISGMYYDWTVTDDVTLANWAGGNMKAKTMRYIGDDKSIDVCNWFDIETGYAYSLSTEAADLEGFDIQAIAEAIYDPAKQIGANAPEPDSVYGPFEAPVIDITDCDTFTQIVDKKLAKGMGYANVTLDGTDALLVCSGTFDNLNDTHAAIDATVYIYKDGAPFEAGYVVSAGTAYPITVKDGKIYTAGHHWVCKSALTDNILVTMEKAGCTYDTAGNATYYYESDDGGDYSNFDSAKAEKIMDQLFDEFMSGENVDFTVVE